MDPYIVLISVVGTVVLLTAWLPLVLSRLPLSLPIVCILLGVMFAWFPLVDVAVFNPLENRYVTERLTEFVVIVALMGAGLKLDRPLGFRSWMVTWRLLGIAMPLTILAVAIWGWGFLHLSVASALLLGAVLAPTDPVLASDVQVGPPGSGDEDEVRFALTSEAGLNDGMSFPFVYLAIAWAASGTGSVEILSHWFLVDVVWKLAAGVAIGWIMGRVLGGITFGLPKRAQLAQTRDGFVALGIACLCYGVTEMAHGYGFIAVFVAALTLRSAERNHEYHENLHSFAEQIERLLMMALMVCFGAVLANGGFVSALTWPIVGSALAIVFILRPLAGWISLWGVPQSRPHKAIIAFFGIRGLGSFYYLAFATGRADFSDSGTVWATLFLVVLISIVIHGIAVTPTMAWVDKAANRKTGQRPLLD